MATGRVPTTANSPLTAKGDLFTYSTAPARLAVGLDGEQIVADSSTSTGLRYQGSQAAAKNTIINGNFDFFQRGSFSGGSAGYALDRWRIDTSGATVTQQTTGVPVGARYCMRVAFTSTGTYADTFQYLETSTVAQLWGQTATLSFKARRNSSFSTTLVGYVQKSATVDAGSGATWTTISSVTITNANLPTATTATDWFSASVTAAIPNDGTANSIRIIFSPGAVQNSPAYYEVAQAQFELGSVATAFTRAGGTIQGELAACQRYYRRLNAGTAYGTFKGVGVCTSTTKAELVVSLDIELRTNPSFASSGSFQVVNGGASTSTTSLASGQLNTTSPQIEAVVASGLTTGFGAYLRSNNSTASYLEFSAEL